VFYIIIPVHNRRNTTKICLENLQANSVFDICRIVVVDDGSADGTSDLVSTLWPSVKILYGDGNLWWGGAIRKGMEYAYSQNDCDGIVWLNDDCRPKAETLRKIIDFAENKMCAVSSQSITPLGYIYGGFIKKWNGLKQVIAKPDQIFTVDSCNGNCVAFHKSIIDRVGFVDNITFPHNFLDLDYTLNVTKSGFSIFVLGSALCDSEDNHSTTHARWTDPKVSTLHLIRSWSSMKSPMNIKYRFKFSIRNWGYYGLVVFLIRYLHFFGIAVWRLLPFKSVVFDVFHKIKTLSIKRDCSIS
jgi:GT2 family glycosyltransferase